jgi:hypothetical protein
METAGTALLGVLNQPSPSNGPRKFDASGSNHFVIKSFSAQLYSALLKTLQAYQLPVAAREVKYPPDRPFRLPEVERLAGLSRSAIYEQMRRGVSAVILAMARPVRPSQEPCRRR